MKNKLEIMAKDGETVLNSLEIVRSNGYLMTLENGLFNKKVYPTKSPEVVREIVAVNLAMCSDNKYNGATVRLVKEEKTDKGYVKTFY
ncbi:MAG: hypothetical protein ABIG69_19340 [Bacteroidota bacterium]